MTSPTPTPTTPDPAVLSSAFKKQVVVSILAVAMIHTISGPVMLHLTAPSPSVAATQPALVHPTSDYVIAWVPVIVFYLLAILASKAPTPAIVAALGLFCAVQVHGLATSPATFTQGIIMKAITLLFLVKGFQAASRRRRLLAGG